MQNPEFIILTQAYPAILQISTVCLSEPEHSIKILSQRRTTPEPAIKIPSALSSFAVNLFFCLCYWCSSKAWRDAVMWVSILTGLTVKFKTMLAILQTSVEKGSLPSYISQKLR